MYNQGLGQQSNYLNSAQTAFGAAQSALNPYAQAGQSVLPTLQSLLTPGQSAATLAQMPGFQFASQYGTKAATNALAARGQGASAGPLATAISQYNNGLASQQYQSIVGNLQGFAGLGANAAGGIASSANNLASIYGSAGNADLGSSIQAGNAQAGTIGNIGNAQASGTLGSANALAGGLTGTGNALSNAAIFNALGGGGSNGGLYSANALANGPSNSAISGASDAQAAQYESMFG